MVLVVVNQVFITENVVFKSGNGNILQQLWGFGEHLKIKWNHFKKYIYLFIFFFFWGGGKNNPGLSPDYRMVCYILIDY